MASSIEPAPYHARFVDFLTKIVFHKKSLNIIWLADRATKCIDRMVNADFSNPSSLYFYGERREFDFENKYSYHLKYLLFIKIPFMNYIVIGYIPYPRIYGNTGFYFVQSLEKFKIHCVHGSDNPKKCKDFQLGHN